MADQPSMGEELGRYHMGIWYEAEKARTHYEKTGETISADQVPTLMDAWRAAMWAVAYAMKVTPKVCDLPKRFTWIGVDYFLVFPPEGPVQIAATSNHQNLCIGLPGWVDPMKVGPKAKT